MRNIWQLICPVVQGVLYRDIGCKHVPEPNGQQCMDLFCSKERWMLVKKFYTGIRERNVNERLSIYFYVYLFAMIGMMYAWHDFYYVWLDRMKPILKRRGPITLLRFSSYFMGSIIMLLSWTTLFWGVLTLNKYFLLPWIIVSMYMTTYEFCSYMRDMWSGRMMFEWHLLLRHAGAFVMLLFVIFQFTFIHNENGANIAESAWFRTYIA